MSASTQRTPGRSAATERKARTANAQLITASTSADHATIRRTPIRRATPRELQAMLLEAFLDQTDSNVEESLETDAESQLSADEIDLSDGPDDETDAEAKGEPEADELIAFEASLRDDQNLEFDATPELIHRLADWYVLRIATDPQTEHVRCTHSVKHWMRDTPRTTDGRSLAEDVHQLRQSLDAMADLFTRRLPRFLARPTPEALLADWRDLQDNRRVESATRQANSTLGADIPRNIDSLDPLEKLAFAELVFDSALSAGKSDARRAEFGDLVDHILLIWPSTGETMPMRMLFEHELWRARLKKAILAK